MPVQTDLPKMTPQEIIDAYPIDMMWTMLLEFFDDNELDINVTQSRENLRALIVTCRDNVAPAATPRYDMFLTILEYVRKRIDVSWVPHAPQELREMWSVRARIIDEFDWRVLD